MPKLPLTALLVVILFQFSACEKESTIPSEIMQMKLTSLKQNDSISYNHFIYDDKMRLLVTIDSTNGGHKYKTEFQYDEKGWLTKATRSSNGGWNPSYTFVHDKDGRIIKKFSSGNILESTYAYDANGRLMADTLYNSRRNDIYEYLTYKYDNSDNVVERKVYLKEAAGFSLKQIVQLQYDTKQNPYYPMFGSLYFVEDNANGKEYILSRNNIISKSYQSGTVVSYLYQYNINNMPQSSARTENTDPLIGIRNYFY